MPVADFTPQQHQVLTRILAGDTVQAAADSVGVHRNTILNWRRSSPDFSNAWESIHYEQAMQWREQVLPLAPLAIDAIREILTNPNTSPAIRLRAALNIHKIVSTPPPAQPENKRTVHIDFSALRQLSATPTPAVAQELTKLTEADAVAVPAKPVAVVQPKPMHNDAQSTPATTPAQATPAQTTTSPATPATATSAVQPETMHNDAQSRPRRLTTAEKLAKLTEIFTAENAVRPCPCRSGKLFGQCCQPRRNQQRAAA